MADNQVSSEEIKRLAAAVVDAIQNLSDDLAAVVAALVYVAVAITCEANEPSPC